MNWVGLNFLFELKIDNILSELKANLAMHFQK